MPPNAIRNRAKVTASTDVGESAIVSRQMLRFVAVSAIAAALNFSSRVVFSAWLPYPAAITLAFFVGLTTAFVLNRRFVFQASTNRLEVQMFWFTLVNLFALAQTLLVSLLFADVLLPGIGIRAHAQEYAHALGIVVPILTSYFGHKHFSFRNSSRS